MTLSNWIGLAIMAAIIIIGLSAYLYFRRKFVKMDGFEGIIAERGKAPRRADFDWAKKDILSLEQELSDKK